MTKGSYPSQTLKVSFFCFFQHKNTSNIKKKIKEPFLVVFLGSKY